MEPSLCGRPLAARGGVRHADGLGRLLHAEAAAEAKLDQAGLAFVEGGELVEGDVQIEEVGVGRGRGGRRIHERDTQTATRFAAPRARAWSTRMRRISREGTPKNCPRFCQAEF